MRPEGRSMRDRILAAAVQLFAEYGYHAAPLRDIAQIAGIQAASIYHHYPNKQALLVEIMETQMQRLIAGLEHMIQEYDDPVTCLNEAIAHHIRLHTMYKNEFFIIDTEMRALEGEHKTHILSLRDRYAALLQGILSKGMRENVFRQGDVKVTSYAIIAMCTEVGAWFRPQGRLSVQQVITIYRELVANGVVELEHPSSLEGISHISYGS
jgi:AcrR family transcriptional regulator